MKKPEQRVDEVRGEILHEICCICVHKPTSIENGLFEDSPKTLRGMGCTYGYEEESKQYCPLAYKVANAILNLKDKDGNPLIYIADADQSLPENDWPHYKVIYSDAQQDMLKANFRKVIIKEESNYETTTSD